MSNSHAKKNYSNIPAKPLIIGTFCGVLSCAVLIFLTTFIITKSGNMPDAITAPLMIVLTGIGTFIGGYASGKTSREKGMVYGMVCGFIMFVLFFLGGFATTRNSVTLLTVIRLFTMLLAGAVGGITGVNKV
jgi:putative membrane protein (TIGR04086 family)